MLKRAIRLLLESNRLIILASFCLIIGLSAFIRIQSAEGLDGKHFLGFDPYYFFRITETIALNGAPPERDMMAYAPLGVKLDYQEILTPYVILFLYRACHILFPSVTLYHTAVFYPVLCFAASLLVFYVLIRRLFDWKTARKPTIKAKGQRDWVLTRPFQLIRLPFRQTMIYKIQDIIGSLTYDN